MSDDSRRAELTPKEAAFLVLLMIKADDLLNSDIRKQWGFQLERDSRAKLNQLGYVESERVGQTFVHRLTDAGWARCYEPLNLESPKARAQGAALAALLQAVVGHVGRTESSLAEFIVGDADNVDSIEPTEELPDRIRSVYAALTQEPAQWLGLTELRAALPDIDRDDLDSALRSLERTHGINIVPESNQKTLRPSDREAALWIGGQHKHYLSIGAS